MAMKIFMQSDLDAFYKEIRTYRLFQHLTNNNLVIPLNFKDEFSDKEELII